MLASWRALDQPKSESQVMLEQLQQDSSPWPQEWQDLPASLWLELLELSRCSLETLAFSLQANSQWTSSPQPWEVGVAWDKVNSDLEC